jgi:hypothetical protein
MMEGERGGEKTVQLNTDFHILHRSGNTSGRECTLL